MRWWLILGAGAAASALIGGGAVGRILAAVVREVARALT
jgi:hypothetical protein